ncbi:MAG: hypothetical protein HKP27_06340, partial [Myxococcales bacterium]|nr:hypothetical protein [Myxococcales bacterium]
VAQSLRKEAKTLKIIERDRQRAEELAARLPDYEIVHGDITDASVLESEGVASAQTFLALTGGDETNLMACLLAQELGARQLMALVQKSETSTLWRKVGLLEVVSPRIIAAERVRTYIEGDYEANIVSLESGGCQFIECRVEKASAAAGAKLSAIEIPEGLVVAAVLRNGRASIPRGDFQLAVGDDVIVFVRRSEADLARLLFPGGTPA